MFFFDKLYNSVKSVIEEKRPCSEKRALAFFLHLLSMPYGAMVFTRHWAYKSTILPQRKLSVPVISVGNLTLGGTGKTPVVSLITRLLLQRGVLPAIVSRGYGGRASGEVNVVSDGKKILMEAESSGDEPFMLAKNFPTVPVVTGKSRYRAGLYATGELGAEAIILDDGYQHMQLFRDFNILLVDGQNFFGNGYLFPRGPLREPEVLKKRADLLVLTRWKKGDRVPLKFTKGLPVSCCAITPKELMKLEREVREPVAAISGKRVFAFCGIGDPHSFFDLLKSVGATLCGYSIFQDHHQYNAGDLDSIISEALAVNASHILTTEKDSVRIHLPASSPLPFTVLKMDMEIISGLDEIEKGIYPFFEDK